MTRAQQHFDDYRPDVDGLRAIAILTVVGYHAGLPVMRGGFVGVDVFFVISGYLITRMLLNEVEATGRIRLGVFVARRIRRLLPAFLLVVLATLALGAWTMFPQELPRFGKSAMSAALISSNFHFQKFTGGYFDPSTDLMPMLHTWTLGLEEQYYLVWPMLFLLAALLSRQLGRRPGAWIGYLLCFIFVASFAFNVLLIENHKSAVFYLMPFRAWEFALGGGLNWFRPRLTGLGRGAGDGLFAGGIAAVMGGAALLDENLPYPGWWAVIPTFGAAAIIAGGCVPAARWPKGFLGSKPMVAIGLLSYSWYLWHWPLLSLARSHSLGMRDMDRDSAIVLASLVLAWATYRMVEVPIRFRRPWAFASNRGTLALGIAMVAIVLGVAGIVVEYGKRRQTELFRLTGQSADGGLAIRLEKCRRDRDLVALEPIDDCSLGRVGAPIALAAWGDSHADHWGPLLSEEADYAQVRILTRIQPTCPPLLGAVPYKGDHGLLECGKYNDLVMEELRRLSQAGWLKGVILAARWNEYLARQETDPGAMLSWALADHWKDLDLSGRGEAPVGVPPYDHAGSTATQARALRRTIEALTSMNLRVLIVAPVPELYFHGPQCVYLRSPEACAVRRDRVEARRQASMTAIREAMRAMENVRLWDPIEEFCDRTTCYAERDGLLQYTDHNHVSPRKAVVTMPVAQPYLSWLLSE